MLWTPGGVLYACGSNAFNKLGLNARFGVLRGGHKTVDGAFVLSKVNATGKGKVAAVALGRTASVVVYDSGKCFTLGLTRNSAEVPPSSLANAASAAAGAAATALPTQASSSNSNSNSNSNGTASRAVLPEHHVKAVAVGGSFVLAAAACTPRCACANRPPAPIANSVINAMLPTRVTCGVFGWGGGLASRCGLAATPALPASAPAPPPSTGLDDGEAAPAMLQLVDDSAGAVDVVHVACFGDAMAVLVSVPRERERTAAGRPSLAAASLVATATATTTATPTVTTAAPVATATAASTPAAVSTPTPAGAGTGTGAGAEAGAGASSGSSVPAAGAAPAADGDGTGTSLRTWLREELRLAAAEAISGNGKTPVAHASEVRKVPSKRINVQLDAELLRARKSRTCLPRCCWGN
jgi:hypothetical protein